MFEILLTAQFGEDFFYACMSLWTIKAFCGFKYRHIVLVVPASWTGLCCAIHRPLTTPIGPNKLPTRLQEVCFALTREKLCVPLQHRNTFTRVHKCFCWLADRGFLFPLPALILLCIVFITSFFHSYFLQITIVLWELLQDYRFFCETKPFFF